MNRKQAKNLKVIAEWENECEKFIETATLSGVHSTSEFFKKTLSDYNKKDIERAAREVKENQEGFYEPYGLEFQKDNMPEVAICNSFMQFAKESNPEFYSKVQEILDKILGKDKYILFGVIFLSRKLVTDFSYTEMRHIFEDLGATEKEIKQLLKKEVVVGLSDETLKLFVEIIRSTIFVPYLNKKGKVLWTSDLHDFYPLKEAAMSQEVRIKFYEKVHKFFDKECSLIKQIIVPRLGELANGRYKIKVKCDGVGSLLNGIELEDIKNNAKVSISFDLPPFYYTIEFKILRAPFRDTKKYHDWGLNYNKLSEFYKDLLQFNSFEALLNKVYTER